MKSSFLKQISVAQLIETYQLLADILFWIKDEKGRVVYANNVFIEHLGFKNLEQVVGKTDLDFSPRHIAHQFITDDQKVMRGELVTNRLELNITANGELAWFSTSKRPLIDEQGTIIGTFGITRHLEKTSKTLSKIDAIALPVKYVKENFAKNITIEELAEVAHLSVSALERRFKKYLAKTPKQFINEIRLERARQMLVETSISIAEIAFQTGFTDPSYFGSQFKKLFGQLPSELRAEIINEPIE